ncbi:MAG: ATP synthase F1 subunit gamma [Lactimicrobium sp.]|jgi:F-type H+-transporting ATPase subunit gamma|uniref:ATP synthase F1 subunit gamma n=1 Tax=Lactimicrobium sp. TaxID=2563780 RepID=UPI002F3612A5
MSQSKQALRSRIKSVNSTKKITRAMEMIANAKLFKQRSKMESNREYAQRLQDTVNEIVAKNKGIDNQFMKPKTAKAVYSIVFCSDLGLCGGYNGNITRYVETYLNKEDPLILIGTSLFNILKEKGFHLVNEKPISSDHMDFMTLKGYVEDGVKLYQENKVGKVQLVYTKFINTMTFVPGEDVLLPCEIKEGQQVTENENHVETLFEPDPDTILDTLIPMMIADVAYSDWMESTTSEQGSRRVAMKTATDNANDLSDKLLLAYNKARQAAITQEITEIVSGSQAV